jgi:hypothetical protein
MKKRTIWKMFLLEIVTLGIYRLYFLIKTRREMMDLNPNVKIKSPAFLLAPILVGIAAFVILFVFIFASAHNQVQCINSSTTYNGSQSVATSNNTNAQNCSSTGSSTSLIALLLFYPLIFVAVILFVVWEWSYSHGVEIITENKLSFALSLIILILVPDGIDILIIQDYFNKLSVSPIPSNPQAFSTQSIPPNVGLPNTDGYPQIVASSSPPQAPSQPDSSYPQPPQQPPA